MKCMQTSLTKKKLEDNEVSRDSSVNLVTELIIGSDCTLIYVYPRSSAPDSTTGVMPVVLGTDDPIRHIRTFLPTVYSLLCPLRL